MYGQYGSNFSTYLLVFALWPGADIKNVVNQSAIRAAVEESKSVTQKHLDYARDKVIMGTQKIRLGDEECNKVGKWGLQK